MNCARRRGPLASRAHLESARTLLADESKVRVGRRTQTHYNTFNCPRRREKAIIEALQDGNGTVGRRIGWLAGRNCELDIDTTEARHTRPADTRKTAVRRGQLTGIGSRQIDCAASAAADGIETRAAAVRLRRGPRELMLPSSRRHLCMTLAPASSECRRRLAVAARTVAECVQRVRFKRAAAVALERLLRARRVSS
jgi:hypothetical protein